MPIDKVYDNFPDWYFGIGRSIIFGVASIFDYPKKSPIMTDFYDSFDVKAFANRYEKSFAWLMMLSLATLLVSVLIYGVADSLELWPSAT